MAIGFASGGSIYHRLHNAAFGRFVVVCAGRIPGYWAVVLTIDLLHCKSIQIGGFLLLILPFTVISFYLNSLGEKPLLALYIFAQLFFNFGQHSFVRTSLN